MSDEWTIVLDRLREALARDPVAWRSMERLVDQLATSKAAGRLRPRTSHGSLRFDLPEGGCVFVSAVAVDNFEISALTPRDLDIAYTRTTTIGEVIDDLFDVVDQGPTYVRRYLEDIRRPPH